MEGELLRRDIHPGEIVLPDGRVLTDARVFITSHRLVAWTHDGRVQVAADIELSVPNSVTGDRGTLSGSLEVQTVDGTVYVNKGRGCGCHSPLKGLSAPVGWTRQAVAA